MGNLNVFKYGYLPWRPRNLFHNFRQFFRNIKYAYQRATKGYCAYDIWDIDSFHTNLLIDALKAFKKDAQGYPGVFSEKPDGEQAWHNEIDRIILHLTNFRDADDICVNVYADAYHKRMEALTETGTDKNGLHFWRVRQPLSDSDRALQEYYLEREKQREEWKQQELETGLALFAKWYQHFWW